MLFKDGEEVDTRIPFQGIPAYTYGEYTRWEFVDWVEEFSSYKDGMMFEEWRVEHRHWLDSIAPHNEHRAIYEAFQSNDWRYDSCGGCI